MKKNSKWIFLTIFFILLLGFKIYRAQFGIDYTDEGTYLSTSMRIALGDVPFRDEFRMGVTAFNVLLSPVFKFFPGITLYQFRLLGIAIHTFGYLALFLILKKFAPLPVVALSVGTAYVFNNYWGIASPSYNVLSSNLSLIAFCLWLNACNQRNNNLSVIFSILAGVCFSVAVMSYFSLSIMILFPVAAGIKAYFKSGIKSKTVFCSGIFLFSFVSVILIALTLLVKNGIFTDFFTVFYRDITARNFSFLDKFYSIFMSFSANLPQSIVFSALMFTPHFLIFGKKHKNSNFYLPAAAAFCLIFFLSFIILKIYNSHMQLFYFSVYLGIFMIIVNKLGKFKSRNAHKYSFQFNTILLWGILISFIYCFSSYDRTLAGLLGISPVFAVGMIEIYLLRKSNYLRFPFYLSLLLFLVMSLRYSYLTVYRDANIDQLNTPFKFPLLKGIKSSDKRVKEVEELLLYLSGKVKKGDYLLAYNNLPLIYYLTQTRPAYAYAWDEGTDDPLNWGEKLYNKMIKDGKIPEYIVRSVPKSEYEDPYLKKFVFSNYKLEKIISSFEIWSVKS